MLTQYEITHMENRMLVDSEWDSYTEYREPCEWDLFDDNELMEVFEDDYPDEF